MAQIKVILKRNVFDFGHNVESVSVGGDPLMCTGINIMFNAQGMELVQFTIPITNVSIEILDQQHENTPNEGS